MRALLLVLLSLSLSAQVKRVVVLKLDGLPQWYVDRALAEQDPTTGKSRAPWIRYVFAERGTRLTHFYTRGLSLSVPAWQILDTGQHLQIHGNVEYNRYTGRIYDYLNFFPFYVSYSRGRQVDMPSVEVLDEVGVPLLLDRFAPAARYQGFQLFQRGVRLRTLQNMLTKRFTTRRPLDLLSEWQAGVRLAQGVNEQLERELVERLNDSRVEYLDLFNGDFDHQAHLVNDPASQQLIFDQIDRQIGRLYYAIQASPLAAHTAFFVVSDHGMNTTEGVYSQGYNLVRFFNSREGGGHHVLTNRHPLQDYKLRGLDPWVQRVVTPSEEPAFPAVTPQKYPTVLLDLDGNERACVHFRNQWLHRLHLLLDQLPKQRTLVPEVMRIVRQERPQWEKALARVRAELQQLQLRLEANPAPARVKRKQFNAAELEDGTFLEAKRTAWRRETWLRDRAGYETYAKSLERLLALDEPTLTQQRYRVEELIPPGVMGEPNTCEDLRSYAVSVRADGTLVTINYLAALRALRTRNQVQKELDPSPIDFLALRSSWDSAIRLYRSESEQLVIRPEGDTIRLQPQGPWRAGLPLRLWEDAKLDVKGDRATWLSEPHSEREWLRATHQTQYSNAVIGLTEQFSPVRGLDREAVQPDLLILANDHWNFNVRSFNPGGNHGSFFRISTHSVMMVWGGDSTGIPRGRVIDEPYDSLSFVPTLLQLMGRAESLPGRPIDLR
jgi:hypothetical protein